MSIEFVSQASWLCLLSVMFQKDSIEIAALVESRPVRNDKNLN